MTEAHFKQKRGQFLIGFLFKVRDIFFVGFKNMLARLILNVRSGVAYGIALLRDDVTM